MISPSPPLFHDVLPPSIVREHLKNPQTQPFEASEVELFEALIWACENNNLSVAKRLILSKTPWGFDEDFPLQTCVKTNSFDVASLIAPYYKGICCLCIAKSLHSNLASKFLDLLVPLASQDEALSQDWVANLIDVGSVIHLQKFEKWVAPHLHSSVSAASIVGSLSDEVSKLFPDIEKINWVLSRSVFSLEDWQKLLHTAVRKQQWAVVQAIQQNAPEKVCIQNSGYYTAGCQNYRSLEDIRNLKNCVDFSKITPTQTQNFMKSFFEGKLLIPPINLTERKWAVEALDLITPMWDCLDKSQRLEYISQMNDFLWEECVEYLLNRYPDINPKELFPALQEGGDTLARKTRQQCEFTEEENIHINATKVDSTGFYELGEDVLKNPIVVNAAVKNQRQAILKRVLHYGGRLTLDNLLEVALWPTNALDAKFIQLCAAACDTNGEEVWSKKKHYCNVLEKSLYAETISSRLLPLLDGVKSEEFFILAIKSNHLPTVQSLKHQISFTPGNPCLEVAASQSLELVKEVVDLSNPFQNNSEALMNAVIAKKADIVEFLIPCCNPRANNSEILTRAASQGSAEIVKMLIPVSCVSDDDFESLRVAVEERHDEVVQLLLPHVDLRFVKIDTNKEYFDEQVAQYQNEVLSETVCDQLERPVVRRLL